MRDISAKITTLRTAVASSRLTMQPATLARIRSGNVPKGDPLEVAKVAAVQAAKNTSQIIPYCHPLPIDFVGVEYELGDSAIVVRVTVKAIYKTGVEMEALTAAAVAALTIYDMLKMLDDTMIIGPIELLSKEGGKSDFQDDLSRPLRAAVLVMSDTVSAGQKSDRSGRLLVDRLKSDGIEVEQYRIVPDDPETIVEVLRSWCDELKLDLVMTTGGTGLSPRDNTPEAMERVFERRVPGIPEAMRAYGQRRTPYAMLSRSTAGVRGQTLIINLPGSSKGVAESLDAILPALRHGFKMLWQQEHVKPVDGNRKSRR